MGTTVDEVMELASVVVEYRDQAGFNSVTEHNLPVKLMCTIAELEELHKAMRADLPSDSVELEMADVAMYLATILYDFQGDLTGSRSVRQPDSSAFDIPERLTSQVRRYVVTSFESWRLGRVNDAVIAAELALMETCRLSWVCNVNLKGAIVAKLEINRRRESRHGGKHPDS